MINRILSAGAFSILLTTASAAAQIEQGEQEFFREQADKLNEYALEAFEAGFPGQAKKVWLMVISDDYDPDNPEARRRLGYQRVGSTWSPDASFTYPREDKPDSNAARRLQGRWTRVARDVGGAHKRLAQNYSKADRTDAARRHYQYVIRFLPDDRDASEALEYKPIAGLSGTPLEQILYDRSITIERAVEIQSDTPYDVTELDTGSDRHPFLDKAGLDYTGVYSDHFVIRGTADQAGLIEAAMYAERAYEVCKVAFDGYDGFNKDADQWVATFAYVDSIETYRRVVTANAELFTKEDLEFILGYTGGCTMSDGETVLVLGTALDQPHLNDGAVRAVARQFAGFTSPALREGIGHTIVGMFLQNNRHFIVDRRTQIRTRASEEEIERYSPNMDTWRDLVLEQAWKATEGTLARQLPVIEAATFPDDARIKAWSFCDYLIRRDPTLLLELDKLNEEPTEFAVEDKFNEANSPLTIEQLEREWKDFWTGATPVLAAIKGGTPPLSAVSRDAGRWLQAFNDIRHEFNRNPVKWSESFSARCKEHADYLSENRRERGAAAEQTQKLDLEGATYEGSLFAQMALVSTAGRDPKQVYQKWMDWPGYRDAILNKYLLTIGLYADSGITVMDGIRGVGQGETLDLWIYPDRTQRAVPDSVPVSELGPEVQKLLEDAGHGRLRTVGYPLTLHFGQAVGGLGSFTCTVAVRDDLVEGVVHRASGGTNRRTSAPGMVVFYPLEPLPRGSVIEVNWSFTTSSGQRRVGTSFETK